MDDERADEPPATVLPNLGDLTRWGAALAGEVAQLPTTVARAREVVVVLPEHLTSLVSSIDRLTGLLETTVEEVRGEVGQVSARLDELQITIDKLAGELGGTREGIDQAIPVISDTVVRLDDRLERMDALLGRLGGTVAGTIDSVPGLRRMARRGRRPADEAGPADPSA